MLEVEPRADARGARKDDLLLASTCTPELLRCFLEGAPCASRRFSATGERFLYWAYDDPERELEERLARRSEFERVLSEALGDCGAVTGVGIGTLRSYIDFAVVDCRLAIERLVSALRRIGAPAASHLEFFDSELRDEYVSIWPHSPPRQK
jgi:hypothetical protein